MKIFSRLLAVKGKHVNILSFDCSNNSCCTTKFVRTMRNVIFNNHLIIIQIESKIKFFVSLAHVMVVRKFNSSQREVAAIHIAMLMWSIFHQLNVVNGAYCEVLVLAVSCSVSVNFSISFTPTFVLYCFHLTLLPISYCSPTYTDVME